MYSVWMSEIKDYVHEAVQHFGLERHLGLEFSWNNRIKSKLGRCFSTRSLKFPLKSRLEFSSSLWPELTLEQRKETAVHEAVHALAVAKYLKEFGRYENLGHNSYWGGLMIELGYEPRSCIAIDNDVMIKIGHRVKINCKCNNGVLVSKTVYNRICRGVRYSCLNCKENLYV